MFFGPDILILTMLLSALFSRFKIVKIKTILLALGISFLFSLPLFFGFDYNSILIKELLGSFVLFLLGTLLFEIIDTLRVRNLNNILLFGLVLICFFKLKDGIDYSYDVVNNDPIILSEKYRIYHNGYRIKTSNINEYRFGRADLIYKLYLGGLLRKQLDSDIVSIDDNSFEHRLKDGVVISYENGEYLLKSQ